MKRSTAILMLAVLIPAAQTLAAPNDVDDLFRGGGEVIVDHQPSRVGGLASDTLYAGGQMMQRVADDVLLTKDVDIVGVNWWGFYSENAAPAQETMRIRFYGARPGGGLPDDNNILFEETFLNPSRTATGYTVFADVDVDEYFFQVALASPVHLEANALSWLEIVQIGDITRRFRWEFSGQGPTGLMFINPAVPDWQETVFSADNAFQLLVPEPSAFGLVLVVVLLAWGKRSRREESL